MQVVSDEKVKEIKNKLEVVESEHKVTILYACESGSRIWEFASQDSDWDVRFIYVRPLDWYLSVDRLYNFKSKSDVIEYPIDSDMIDMSGWDLSKALYQLYKSNCPLLEWLNSSIKYINNSSLVEDMMIAGGRAWSIKKAMYHYLSMTEGNTKDYLIGRDLVWIKKYIYILRTLLCCLYIEKRQIYPPVSIFDLIRDVPNPKDVTREIESLLKRKIAGEELGKDKPNDILNNFIFMEIERLKQKVIPILLEIQKPDSLELINPILQKWMIGVRKNR